MLFEFISSLTSKFTSAEDRWLPAIGFPGRNQGMEKILLLFTSPPYGRIQEVVDAGVVPRLYELLDHPEDQVVSKALQTINNIVSGSTPSSYSNLAAGG